MVKVPSLFDVGANIGNAIKAIENPEFTKMIEGLPVALAQWGEFLKTILQQQNAILEKQKEQDVLLLRIANAVDPQPIAQYFEEAQRNAGNDPRNSSAGHTSTSPT